MNSLSWQQAVFLSTLLFLCMSVCVCACVSQSGSLIDRVFNTYKLMHTNQTMDFVLKKVSKLGASIQKFSKVSPNVSLQNNY